MEGRSERSSNRGAWVLGKRPGRGALIKSVLEATDKALSAQDIRDALSQRHLKVGVATIYRHLHHFESLGEVERTVLPSAPNETFFRLCSIEKSEHAHIVCKRCGRENVIENDLLVQWASETSNFHGFEDIEVNVQVLGLCESCGKIK